MPSRSWLILTLLGVSSIAVGCDRSSGSRRTGPAAQGDSLEPNDSPGSCTGVALDYSHLDLTLHTSTDVDYFCFTLDLPSDVTAAATFDPALGDVALELLDPMGGVLAAGQPGPGGRVLVAPVPCGDSLVRVFGPSGPLQPYGIDISAVANTSPLPLDSNEPDDDPATCTALQDPRFGVQSISGLTLHNGLNEDWYCFPLGGVADVEISVNSISPVNAMEVELLDAGLNVLGSGGLFDRVLSAGDYFIRIYPLNCEKSSYSLDVSEV